METSKKMEKINLPYECILIIMSFFKIELFLEMSKMSDKLKYCENYISTQKILDFTKKSNKYIIEKLIVNCNIFNNINFIRLHTLIINDGKYFFNNNNDSIFKITNLKTVVIKLLNKIDDNVIRFFKNNSNIKKLSISYKPEIINENDSINDIINLLPNLEYLYLNSLFYKKGILNITLKNIKTLILNNIKFNDVIFKNNVLKELTISHYVINTSCFKYLKKLKKLVFYNCEPIINKNEDFKYLKNLEEFSDCSNKYKYYLIYKYLTNLKVLKKIRFSNLNELAYINDLKNLNKLIIHNNYIKQLCICDIKQKIINRTCNSCSDKLIVTYINSHPTLKIINDYKYI